VSLFVLALALLSLSLLFDSLTRPRLLRFPRLLIERIPPLFA
jgi:hypothetical protein